MPHAESSSPLAGRVALVTGASSGLGRRFAEALAGAAALVMLAADEMGPVFRVNLEGVCLTTSEGARRMIDGGQSLT